MHVMRGMAFLMRACEQSAIEGDMGGGMSGGMSGGMGGGLMSLDGMDLWLCHMVAHHTRHGQHDLHQHEHQHQHRHQPRPMSTDARDDQPVDESVDVEVDACVAGLDVALLMISASSVHPNDVRALAQSLQDLLTHALGGGRNRGRDRDGGHDRGRGRGRDVDPPSNAALQLGSVCVNLLTLLTSPVRNQRLLK